MFYTHQLGGQSYADVNFKKFQVVDLMSLTHFLVQSFEQFVYFLNHQTRVQIAMLFIFSQFALINFQTFSDSFDIHRKIDRIKATWLEKQFTQSQPGFFDLTKLFFEFPLQ